MSDPIGQSMAMYGYVKKTEVCFTGAEATDPHRSGTTDRRGLHGSWAWRRIFLKQLHCCKDAANPWHELPLSLTCTRLQTAYICIAQKHTPMRNIFFAAALLSLVSIGCSDDDDDNNNGPSIPNDYSGVYSGLTNTITSARCSERIRSLKHTLVTKTGWPLHLGAFCSWRRFDQGVFRYDR